MILKQRMSELDGSMFLNRLMISSCVHAVFTKSLSLLAT